MGFYVRGFNGETRACTRANTPILVQALQIVRGMVMTNSLRSLLVALARKAYTL